MRRVQHTLQVCGSVVLAPAITYCERSPTNSYKRYNDVLRFKVCDRSLLRTDLSHTMLDPGRTLEREDGVRGAFSTQRSHSCFIQELSFRQCEGKRLIHQTTQLGLQKLALLPPPAARDEVGCMKLKSRVAFVLRRALGL